MREPPGKKYWTGLKRKNATCYEFSDGTSANNAETRVNQTKSSSDSGSCFYIEKDERKLDDENCKKEMYFICQVNKGNI
jgi:hypothetical protein